jgi:hypothetical protein
MKSCEANALSLLEVIISHFAFITVEIDFLWVSLAVGAMALLKLRLTGRIGKALSEIERALYLHVQNYGERGSHSCLFTFSLGISDG